MNPQCNNNANAIGLIHKTESFGAVDGPGIRFVVFLQGCPLQCLYCHNPDAINCTGGVRKTAEELVNEIMRYKNFIKNGGVTFSGGEPLEQADFVNACIKLLHSNNLHTAIDTSGIMDINDYSVKAAIDNCDLVLLDIKAFDEHTAIKISGQSNENAFKMLNYCEKSNKPVWIRHVLVDGYTLNEESLKALAEYLSHYKCIKQIELLPFHKLGEHKWALTNLEYKLKNTPATTREQLEWAASFFKPNFDKRIHLS